MRIPMGVPVVRPSKTPDNKRTTSASCLWLTNFEVPVRRRSTSACRSASLSSRPGGHPSTMQPSAGPWLSPKVVTANSLPKVLPDISNPEEEVRSLKDSPFQLLRRQQENPAAAALELQPCKWKRAKRA